MPTCPEYRARLFLSVDLVGSTAFKGGLGDTQVDGSAHPLWVEEIRKFYQEFPTVLLNKFAHQTSPAEFTTYNTNPPVVWKTVGDEILFCCRIRALDHLVCVVNAFTASLEDYGKVLETRGGHLDVKGTGWLAAFPAPNVTVEIFQGATQSKATDVPSDEIEVRADTDPHKFDFLGKGIDCGFRLAKYSSTDKLTLSIELALALCDASDSQGLKFKGKFNYLGREELKGVMKGRPYPIVFLDTERNSSRSKVADLERSVNGRQLVAPINLAIYLRHLMADEGLEEIIFVEDGEKLADGRRPKSYSGFREAWDSISNEFNKREQTVADGDAAADEAGQITDAVEAALSKIPPANSNPAG